jgi:acyl carrier protein
MTFASFPPDESSTGSLEDRIRNLILRAIPKLGSGEIKNELSLFTLGIDSLDHAKILMTIEDDLGIEINDEDINNLKSIDDLCTYCAARISAPS